MLLMKGGKDMKKIYSFEEQEEKYIVFCNKDEIFTINKNTLKIEGNKFYDAFFDSYSIGDTIEIKKGNSINKDEKLSNAVYDTIISLINDIIQKINEQKEE